MVALGAAINAPAATNPVLTTINQSLLKSDVTYRTVAETPRSPAARHRPHWNGSTTTAPATSSRVEFPTPPSRASNQTGSWQSINTGQSADPVTLGVFSLHLNHGTAVNGGSYSYIVAPGLDPAAMDAFPVTNYQVLRNDATVQAVKDTAADKTSANFWAAGTVGDLTCDSKASVIMKRDGTFIDLSISDPTQSQHRKHRIGAGITRGRIDPRGHRSHRRTVVAHPADPAGRGEILRQILQGPLLPPAERVRNRHARPDSRLPTCTTPARPTSAPRRPSPAS
jgi:hypothetical protein